MKKFVYATLLLLGITTVCLGDCFQRQIVAVQQVVTPALIAVPIVVPAYSVSYNPQSEIDALRARIATLEKGRAELIPPPSTNPTNSTPMPAATDVAAAQTRFRAIATANCVQCHTSGTGAKTSVFDGSGDLLPTVSKAKVVRMVYRGEMPKPPNKPLGQEDADFIMDYLGK